MKKNILTILISIAFVLNAFSQDVKKEAKTVETKMEAFA